MISVKPVMQANMLTRKCFLFTQQPLWLLKSTGMRTKSGPQAHLVLGDGNVSSCSEQQPVADSTYSWLIAISIDFGSVVAIGIG